jgi:hypothetical protein
MLHRKSMATEAVRTRHRPVPESFVERDVEASMVPEPVMPAPSAKRELVTAPTVPAKTAMSKAAVETVSEVMCKGVAAETVAAETVAAETVAAVMGPAERPAMTPSPVGKCVSEPAVPAVMMSVSESAVPCPAELSARPVMPVTTPFVIRPASRLAVPPGVAEMVTMTVVTVMAGPGETAAVAALAVKAAKTLAAFTVVPAPSAFATVTALGEFVPHAALVAFSARSAFGMFPRSALSVSAFSPAPFTALGEFVPHAALVAFTARSAFGIFPRSALGRFAFSPAPFAALGKFARGPLRATSSSRSPSEVGVVAIRVSIAPTRFSRPAVAGPLATHVVATEVAIIAPIVGQLIRPHFVCLQSSPFPMGRELGQRGRRDSANKQQHVSSHFQTALQPLEPPDFFESRLRQL